MLSRLSQKMTLLSLTINLHVSESHSHPGLVDGQGKVINKKYYTTTKSKQVEKYRLNLCWLNSVSIAQVCWDGVKKGQMSQFFEGCEAT